MATHSLNSLLEKMKRGSITSGWGAVLAFGRAQLNRMLQEQYLAWLDKGRFIPPITGEVFTESRTESMKLEGLVLGQPVLSFRKALLNQSFVTVSMNIVAGSYTAISRPLGDGAQQLMSTFKITEAMGYKIEMKVSVNQIKGSVDKRGRVALDLGRAEELTCNLGGLPGVTKPVAAFIKEYLTLLPEDMRTFELGLLDLSGNNPLSPTDFYIRTQKVPGREEKDDDGAVLVFVRLKFNEKDGLFPIEGSGFPYLIPDDLSAGKPLYSASMVLSQDLLELLDEVQLDVLKNLILPGENLFVESLNGRHTPNDLLILGNLKPTDESVSIDPPFIYLKSGNTQAFTARKSDGTTVSAQWQVSNPVSPLSVGTITSTGGVYTTPAPSRMGKEQQPVVVTAQYAMGGVQRTSSAFVLGVYESMSISPRVCTSAIGAAGIPLTAFTLSGGSLQWPVLKPSEGTLTVVDNNNAIYKPPAELSEQVKVQTIRVTDSQTKETIDASIVLMKSPHLWPVDPPYVAAISEDTPIQLYADLEPDNAKWVVIGEGEVDETGLFTPPKDPTTRVSVVRCSYLVNGTVRASGLSIIELTKQKMPDPTWSELATFSIVASGGLNQCFSNGYQQIAVMVKIETSPVEIGGENVYIPVSDAHLSTLRLVHASSHSPVPFVPAGQEGIEYESGIDWAVNKKRNRFKLFSPSNAATPNSVSVPAPQNNGVRYRELWIQLTKQGSHTFYAQFNSDKGTFNSNQPMAEGSEITVQGIASPTADISHYKFAGERVAQDELGKDGPPSKLYPEGDTFSFYRQSTDYWRLRYLRVGTFPVLFSTATIEGNVSTIQWESELIDENFVSFTGIAFNPANFENSDSPAPQGLTFDPYLWGLMRLRNIKLDSSFVINEEPSSGELMVSLHRTNDVKYWYDGLAEGDKRKMYRKHLDPGLKIVLVDEEGNRHSLIIAFDNPTKEDSRNRLTISRT
ncbi:hypothetical protein ASE98_08845 [Pseudomonas sp. Leaf48]|uniref:hypothetical protein n=1 Tax=Pseudomonas sp. Leaf48 TaxID=1736221 RepID=UPI00072941E6|nr:hypothetical protein [Pseudomonas sp. Leaf48]KQN45038.1 hypothetical protein ASE98_08845 [Pseudomonas sp. Leaf48]